MLELIRNDTDDILEVFVSEEQLHSDDGESWFLPKHLARKVSVSELPLSVPFEICLHHDGEFVQVDSVPYSITRLNDNKVRIDFHEYTPKLMSYAGETLNLESEILARHTAILERSKQVGDVSLDNFCADEDDVSLEYSTSFEAESLETLLEFVDELLLEIEGTVEFTYESPMEPISEAENEKLFTLKTVIPLLRKLGFQNVRYNHGTREFGRDVIFSRYTEFGEFEYWAVQTKFGDVSGNASSIINTIIGQIDDAFKMPFHDIYSRQQQRISRLLIVISGKFSNNAIEKICESISISAVRNNTLFIDGEKIESLSERFRPKKAT